MTTPDSSSNASTEVPKKLNPRTITTDEIREGKSRDLAIDCSWSWVNGTKYKIAGGTARLGAKVYGAVLGCPTSIHNVLAVPVAEELAKELGIPFIKAKSYYWLIGRIMQRMILRGEPVGIPYLGCIGVRRYIRSPQEMAIKIHKVKRRIAKYREAMARNERGWRTLTYEKLLKGAETYLERMTPIYSRLFFVQSTMAARFYGINAPYTAPIKDHARLVRQRLKAQKGKYLLDHYLLRRKFRIALENNQPIYRRETDNDTFFTADIRNQYIALYGDEENARGGQECGREAAT